VVFFSFLPPLSSLLIPYRALKSFPYLPIGLCAKLRPDRFLIGVTFLVPVDVDVVRSSFLLCRFPSQPRLPFLRPAIFFLFPPSLQDFPYVSTEAFPLVFDEVIVGFASFSLAV